MSTSTKEQLISDDPPLEGDATRKLDEELGSSAKAFFVAPSIKGIATGFFELIPGVPSPSLFRELVSEFFGIFLIVHLGCATVCSAIFTQDIYGM